MISTAEYLAPVREARILVARLEEMKDAAEFRGRNLKRLEDRAQQAAIEVAKAQQRLGNAEPGDAKMNAQADVDRAKRVQDSLGLQLDVIKVQEASKADQLSKIDELIRWARENFKELND